MKQQQKFNKSANVYIYLQSIWKVLCLDYIYIAVCINIYEASWHLLDWAGGCFAVFISLFFTLEVIWKGCCVASEKLLYRPPHSDAIFSFQLHKMECLISASLTQPVMCLHFFFHAHTFQESNWNVSSESKHQAKRLTQTTVACNIHAVVLSSWIKLTAFLMWHLEILLWRLAGPD